MLPHLSCSLCQSVSVTSDISADFSACCNTTKSYFLSCSPFIAFHVFSVNRIQIFFTIHMHLCLSDCCTITASSEVLRQKHIICVLALYCHHILYIVLNFVSSLSLQTERPQKSISLSRVATEIKLAQKTYAVSLIA